MAVDKERLVVEGGPRAGRLQDTIKAVERKSKEQCDWAIREPPLHAERCCNTRPLWSDVFSCSLSEMALR